MIPSPEGGSQSRRTLLAGGVGAVGVAMLAACSGSKPLRVKVRNGAKVQPADIATLGALLDLEHHTIAAYTAGIPLLRRPTFKVAQQFLGQELAHAQALDDLIRRAGGKPKKPLAHYDLGNPTTASEVLTLLRGLERAQLAAYVERIPLLTPGKLRSAVAAIFANDAQHLAVLRSELGEPAAPAAFVTGG